jgi:hypothetical protein
MVQCPVWAVAVEMGLVLGEDLRLVGVCRSGAYEMPRLTPD